MNIYTSKVSSKCNALKECGMAAYTLCKEQDGASVINSFMGEVLTYEMCSYVRKALKNVVARPNEVTTLYFLTEREFQKFCILASEDNTSVTSDGMKILSFSLMSNLLFTTDKKFIQSDIPDVQSPSKCVYRLDDVYIIRTVHVVEEDENENHRRVTATDIMVYLPERYMQ